jgi:dihydrofolate reductase
VTRVVLVAARDRRGAIGRDNALPWHLPADLKRFKAITLGHPVLMGRKTAQSIGRALPGRRNLVLTRSGKVPFAGQEAVGSFEAAMTLAGDTLMVIGGGEIYRLALPHADVLELTEVDAVVNGATAFFPAFDESAWIETFRESHDGFVFRTLARPV